MKAFILFLTALICFTLLHRTCSAKNLQIGNMAPNFELKNQDGQTVTLNDFKGQKVALYFYPKDNTPGCSEQACSLSDSFAALTEAGITILGLSGGSTKSKQKFIAKKHLPFTLLIATKQTFKDYGVNAKWYNVLSWLFNLPKRWTFLVNEYGMIVGIIKDVDTKNHAQQILDGFNAVK
jgi:thioredoxin-dependent peroxiredoxin